MKEVVIRMSDDMFERIMKAQSVPDMYGTDIVNAMNCIKSGTVLPEGHGALIDRHELKQHSCGGDYDGCGGFTQEYIPISDVDSAPVIIPADKEKE